MAKTNSRPKSTEKSKAARVYSVSAETPLVDDPPGSGQMDQEKINEYVKQIENRTVFEDGFMERFMQVFSEEPLLRTFYNRLILECEVVQKLARECSKEVLAELKKAKQELRNAEDAKELNECDERFHRLLFKAAGMGEYLRWWKDDGWWRFIIDDSDGCDKIKIIHGTIYDAINTGHVEIAVKATQEHFAQLFLLLMGYLKKKKGDLHALPKV